MSSRRVGAAFLVGLLLTAPGAAHADAPDDSPAVIERCSVDEQSALNDPRLGPQIPHVNAIDIRYHLERGPAREVRFRLRYGGKTFTFRDTGDLAPHVAMNRAFTKISSQYAGSVVECRATSVAFADGTRWEAPDASPSPAPSP